MINYLIFRKHLEECLAYTAGRIEFLETRDDLSEKQAEMLETLNVLEDGLLTCLADIEHLQEADLLA